METEEKDRERGKRDRQRDGARVFNILGAVVWVHRRLGHHMWGDRRKERGSDGDRGER